MPERKPLPREEVVYPGPPPPPSLWTRGRGWLAVVLRRLRRPTENQRMAELIQRSIDEARVMVRPGNMHVVAPPPLTGYSDAKLWALHDLAVRMLDEAQRKPPQIQALPAANDDEVLDWGSGEAP